MTMRTSAAGRTAIIQREGLRLKAYVDSVGVLTIGVGHTGRASPPAVVAGMTITAAQADEILSRDLAPFEAAVNAAIKRPISQNAFDACVSLAFNIGAPAFAKSTVARLVAAGDMQGAADAFMMWDKAGGHVLTGLQNRRASERAQFLKPDALTPVPSTAPPVQPVTAPAHVLPPVAPKPKTKTATVGAVVVAAGGAAAAASGQTGHETALWVVVALAVVALAVVLFLHFRKKG